MVILKGPGEVGAVREEQPTLARKLPFMDISNVECTRWLQILSLCILFLLLSRFEIVENVNTAAAEFVLLELSSKQVRICSEAVEAVAMADVLTELSLVL